ncbi:nucleotidyltransferase domain-containing protein [Paenibacillus harenae]|uniref:nucleotidyltransferase domain-containing protein n=1 Tax=Paenibacillus harenae TaxID=306543 RepID=UPI00049174F4|nr:nucleotidyltransferase family protein [Paenibacillus harenae]
MIWKLLQAIYDTSVPIPSEPEILEPALDDIAYFRVAPQVYQLLKQQERLDSLPAAYRNRLKNKYDETVRSNLYIHYENERILQAFEASEIPVIPLKGVRFAMKYFGHIGARGTSDIDLLLKKSDMKRAEACIRQLGFTNEEKTIRAHFHRSFSKPLAGTPHSLTVELHWGLLMEGTSRYSIAPFWHEAVPLKPYKQVMELSEYHLFYMICLHGWKHGLNSPKYLIDIVQLLEVSGDRISFDRLLQDASIHRTYKRIASTLSIVYRQFPYLEARKPLKLSKRRGNWWDYDTVRGKKKNTITRYTRFLQYQWLDFDSPSHGLAASVHYLESLVLFRKGVKTNDQTYV